MTAEVRRLVARPNYAHIATLMPDGAPHSVPVWIDLEGDNLAILTGPGSRKARNLELPGSRSRSSTSISRTRQR
jgi:nitroimidazol reductase NimA-like FMN-containing flavoprotein (pyridoxamine 5'-phosphate oxidase superfamily)